MRVSLPDNKAAGEFLQGDCLITAVQGVDQDGYGDAAAITYNGIAYLGGSQVPFENMTPSHLRPPSNVETQAARPGDLGRAVVLADTLYISVVEYPRMDGTCDGGAQTATNANALALLGLQPEQLARLLAVANGGG